jgi:hypothetical protein
MNLSISRLSELTGHDRRAISAKLADLQSIDGPKGARLYPAATALRPLLCLGDNGEKLDPSQERALLDKVRRRGIEMANEKAAGKLLDADLVAQTWAAQVGIARGRLLALPARLAPAVLGLGDLRAIEAVIREAIHEVLTELSSDPT